MELFRHGEEVLRHRTRSIASNSSNSEMQTILAGQSFYSSCGSHALKWLMSLRDPTGRLAWRALTCRDMTSRSNTVQEKITVMQIPYHDVCTLFPSSLCYHKPRQRSYTTLKTVMTNSNLLSNNYRMGLYPRTPPRVSATCSMAS